MAANLSNVSESYPLNDSQMGLKQFLESKLSNYFKDLNGEKPCSQLYEHMMEAMERPLLLMALEYCGGNKLKAAEFLGMNRNTFCKKLKTYQMDSHG